MSVAKVIEISAESPQGFEDAIQRGLDRVENTVANLESAWINEQHVRIGDDGKIAAYRVNMRVTFIVDDDVNL